MIKETKLKLVFRVYTSGNEITHSETFNLKQDKIRTSHYVFTSETFVVLAGSRDNRPNIKLDATLIVGPNLIEN